jgi:cellulose biosynthesis protein BcsQ
MEDALREAYGDLVFKAKINKRIKIEESPALQKPITDHDPQGPSAREFRAVIDEIMQRINK